jgi:hypothetical protein
VHRKKLLQYHLVRGGDDEVEETNGREDQQKQGEVTPPKDPVDEADPLKKRKVSPMKPTSQRNPEPP